MIKKMFHFLDKYSIGILGVMLMAVFFWIISTFTSATTIEEDANRAVKDFNENWSCTYGGKTEQLEIVPTKTRVQRGNTYTLRNQLPQDIQDGMTLTICTTRQTGAVRIDKKQRKVLANESGMLFEKFPISKVHFVPLQKKDAGKSIEIELVSYSVEYSGRVNEMYYGPYGECMKTNFMAQAPTAALYLFLLFVGIVLVVLFFFIREQKRSYLEILLLGFTTVILVLSIIAEYNLFQNYLKSDVGMSLVGLLAKLLLPFSYLGYIYIQTQSAHAKKTFKKTAVLFLVLTLTVLLFHLLGIMDLGMGMNVYTVSTIFMYALSVIYIIVEICRKYVYSKIPLFLALHILMFTILVEVFLYFQNVMSYRNFGVFLGAGIICSLCIMGAVSTNNIIKTFEENRKIREELLEKRIHLMLRQIRPHFVYNTLNSIQALIEVDKEKAGKMIHDFSKYLRTHIDTIESEGLVSFGEELEHIKTYVDIETVRFPKIQVLYEIEEEEFLIPLLSVQPIVENAIRHGVSKKKSGGIVIIKTYKTKAAYVVEVNDNGVGFATEKVQEESESSNKQSVGIKNITYRLSKLVNATLQCTSSVNGGTNIRIDIPMRGGEVDENHFSG